VTERELLKATDHVAPYNPRSALRRSHLYKVAVRVVEAYARGQRVLEAIPLEALEDLSRGGI